MFGPLGGVCLFGLAIQWDITRMLCLHFFLGGGGVVCHIPHRIREEVPDTIKYGLLSTY